jgi:hypothetical protein
MSSRIEHADALAILRELPENWAQACITSPPHETPARMLDAVLAEVHRVLRFDGTLWLYAPRLPVEASALRACGFHPQEAPWWAAPLATSGIRVLMASKRERFFCDPPSLNPRRPRHFSCTSSRCLQPRSAAPADCVREVDAQLARRLLLASTSPRACGVCGAPYRRTEGPGQRCASCAHRDASGRCLVIDPFHERGVSLVGEVAQRHGRSFLGIAQAGERQ